MKRPTWSSGPWVPGLLAVVPLATAATRAIQSSWYPIGDNAFFTLRARDVFTEHHPLLGTWTSASLTVGTTINNPGPLLFDVLAGPAKVDPSVGTVLAVVALHIAAVAIAVRWAHRVAGSLGAWASATAFLALEWAMGSEVLVEPWQPHSLLPAFLALLVLAWALVAGEAGALPWAAGVASLILQTHLSYALLVPVLALVGVGALVIDRVRRSGRAGAWVELRRPAGVAMLVLGLAWLQPVAEQIGGDGNLAKVATSGSGDGPAAGAEFGARVLASVVAVPGGWGPGGFEGLRVDLVTDQEAGVAPTLVGVTGLRHAVPWIALSLAVLALAAWWAVRDRDRPWGSGLLVAFVALAAVFATVSLLPVSPLLGVAAHQVRPVWPVAVFATSIVLGSLSRRVPRGGLILPVLAAALVVVAVPAHNPRTGPSADAFAMPIVRDLVEQMDEVDGLELVFVDLSVIRFAEPYSTPVLLELQRRGVDFVVDDDTAAQVGRNRARQPSDDVQAELRIVDGGAAATPEPGWQRIAYVAGLTAAEAQELGALDGRADAGERLDAADTERREELEHQQVFETAAVLLREVP